MGFLKEKIVLPFEIITKNVEETESFAQKLGEAVFPFELIAFFGEMGAGKTAFVKGFSRAFNVSDLVCSPTFSIVNEYPYDGQNKLVHCDMYRINSEEDLYGVAFFDILKDKNSIVLVEWSENILEFLPNEYIKVQIECLDEKRRKIFVDWERD